MSQSRVRAKTLCLRAWYFKEPVSKSDKEVLAHTGLSNGALGQLVS